MLAPARNCGVHCVYEFLLSLISPHGTALSLAYSQTDFLPLLQIAALAGIWGITFVVTLVPSAIVVAWTGRATAARARADVLNVFSGAARAGRVTVIAGVNRIGIRPLRNVTVVFAPDGHVIAEYEKHHLLPGPETGYQTGAIPGLFSAPGALWGVAICKDMDFPGWSRGYGRRGVRILAVPAWTRAALPRFRYAALLASCGDIPLARFLSVSVPR